MGEYYGTPVTALSLHDGWMDINIETDEEMTPQVKFYPPWTSGTKIVLEEDSFLKKDKFSYKRKWGTNEFKVKGHFSNCVNFEESYSVWNPALQFVETVKGRLIERGIPVEGQSQVYDAPLNVETTYLFSHHSFALSELAQVLMKESQNHYADCFLKTTARQMTGEGSFKKGSELATQFILESMGISTLDTQNKQDKIGFSMLDGSGLSSHNAIQPQHLVALLKYGMNQPYWEKWLNTFPIMGLDGTLEKRDSQDGLTKGRVWAKTGYIFRSRALSGYLETLDGEPIVFSIILNNYSCPTKKVNQAQDDICALMIRLKGNRQVKNDIQNRYKFTHALNGHQ